MNKTYDIIVIGVGMAGLGTARRTAAAGKKVAVVDARPYGGTCALRGCDPKQVLVGAAELVAWQRRMKGHGVEGELRIDWAELMTFKRTFTEPVPDNLEKSLSNLGVATYHGGARFVGRNRLEVGDDTLTAEHIVIAVGAKPRDLRIPGAEHVITSTDFLDLETLPNRIVFIGGGYISFEFAHVAAPVYGHEVEEEMDNPSKTITNLYKYVGELETYIKNNTHCTPNYGERYRNGERISTGFVESTVNQVVSKRFCKKQQMRWTKRGAHLLLQTRTAVLNDELEETFRQ